MLGTAWALAGQRTGKEFVFVEPWSRTPRLLVELKTAVLGGGRLLGCENDLPTVQVRRLKLECRMLSFLDPPGSGTSCLLSVAEYRVM